MRTEQPHLKLAGVTRLDVRGKRGPLDVFVFDPHRLALPCWTLAVGDGAPALLVTLDRHFDLVPPANPRAVPARDAGLRAVDEHTRWELDDRNVDHILAAMEAGVISDVIAVARSHPGGAHHGDGWVDRNGEAHQILTAPTLDALLADPDTEALIQNARRIILDMDLDCFTSLSDADPTEVLPWPTDVIRGFLMPEDAWWNTLLPRCIAMTMACEPVHCGGMVRGNRLFEDVARVVFMELLGASLP